MGEIAPRKQLRTISAMKWFSGRLGINLLAVATAITVAGWGARFSHRLELLTHFRLQLTFACGVITLLLLFSRHKRMLVAASLLLVWHLAAILPIYFESPLPASQAPRWKVLFANVYARNTQTQALLELVRREQPDMLVCAEVTRDWAEQLEALREMLPFSVVEPQAGAFGIALYSRLPLGTHHVLRSAGGGLRTIIARVDPSDSLPFTIVGAHPPPPQRRSQGVWLRDAQLLEIAHEVAQLSGPVVLVGDLNCTSWSPNFHDLLKATNLRDARAGFGQQPSWPNFLWPFRIPIDHTLVSQEIEVTDRRLGPDIHSDHRPVLLEFRVKQAPP